MTDDFEQWREKHGQFCRSGGGEYEKTFAFRAWEAATGKAPTSRLRPKRDALRWAVWWSLPAMWALQWFAPQAGPISGWVLGVAAGSAAAYGAMCMRSNTNVCGLPHGKEDK